MGCGLSLVHKGVLYAAFTSSFGFVFLCYPLFTTVNAVCRFVLLVLLAQDRHETLGMPTAPQRGERRVGALLQ